MDYHKTIAHIFRQIKGMYIEKHHPEIKNPYASVNLKNLKNIKIIDKFLYKLQEKYGIESIGKNFLIDYIAYQFCCYLESESLVNIQLTWIIGNKAWERWINRTEHYQYWYREKLFKNNINLEHIYSLVENPAVRDLLTYQDTIRKKNKNTPEGLMYCVMSGVSYNQNSYECQTCRFTKTCKTIKNEHYGTTT